MKKCLWLLLVAPLFLLAGDVAVEVPAEISDLVDTTVGNLVAGTFLVSSTVMAAVQLLKRVFKSVNIEISGIRSQAAVIILTVLFVIIDMDFWDRGVITKADWILMIQGVVSAVGSIYGYKLLWRKSGVDLSKEIKQ